MILKAETLSFENVLIHLCYSTSLSVFIFIGN